MHKEAWKCLYLKDPIQTGGFFRVERYYHINKLTEEDKKWEKKADC